MRYPYFFCRREQMWHDGWTYGDWRQYICNRPGGQTQCARFSTMPVFGLLVGVIVWALMGMTIFVARVNHFELNWLRVGVFVVVGGMLMTPFILGLFFRTYLMKAVGPMNDGARRVLPGEERR